ncbi:hypothetical protein AB0C33_01065 [Nonomuraea sp. NPDC048881]|uniref:hypothetical protein n=1 Tax=Nonomuraea sp. NPDC048881 TaxID=3155030 RepID=UPI0033E57439
MSKSHDLSAFLASYGPSFARTAYLLTGDADKARELATAALVASCRRWSAIRYHRPADAVLRELYGRFLGATGAPWPVPEGQLLAGLAPRTRAAVVVTFHDGLSLPHAAQVTGLWIGALDDELRRARTQLRATHPTLFENPADLTKDPTDPPEDPANPPEKRANPSEERADMAEERADMAEERADMAEGRQGDRSRNGATSASPWTLAPAPEPTAPWTLAPAPEPTASWTLGPAPELAAPAAGPHDAAPGDPALRAALLGLAAGMPRAGLADLAETVLRRVTARRRIRASVWTCASLGLVAAMVAAAAAGLSALAARMDEATARSPIGPGTRAPAQEIRDPLPAALPDPVRFAYPGYCRDAEADARDPQPCGQWVLTTRSGAEWRLPDARAGYDPATGEYMPLALSQDGHRLLYQNPQGRYLVQDLPTGVVKRIDATAGDGEAHISSSPDGRYFALSFGDADDSAVLDFRTGTTRTVRGADVEILAVHDDGTRVVAERRDTTAVPGHASVSTLRLDGAGARTKGFRIDPALIEHGAALAPDGRSLALVTADDRLVTMDARTGRVTGPRPRLDVDDLEVIRVERWLSRDKVLVRLWDEEDVHLVQVDVRTGESADLGDSATEWIDYSDPLGALER